MRRRIYLLLAVFFSATLLWGRAFESARGDKLEGEISAVVSGAAIVKTADGRTVNIPLDTFCEKDRRYAELWAIGDLLKRDGVLRVKTQSVKSDVSQSKQESIVVTLWKAGYKVTLENLAPFSLDNLKVQYGIFKFNEETAADRRGIGDVQNLWASDVVKLIEARKSESFDTRKVPMTASKLRGGWVYEGGGRRKSSDDLRGIWLRVYWRGMLILDHKSSPSAIGDTPWGGAKAPADD